MCKNRKVDRKSDLMLLVNLLYRRFSSITNKYSNLFINDFFKAKRHSRIASARLGSIEKPER
jgi:hypothetical protein